LGFTRTVSTGETVSPDRACSRDRIVGSKEKLQPPRESTVALLTGTKLISPARRMKTVTGLPGG
jgi:hypothetical protein